MSTPAIRATIRLPLPLLVLGTQMTMTTPERLITLQRSQRGFTDAETFISSCT